MSCTICAKPGPNDAAHLRSSALQYDKPHTGMGEKPDDKWVLPLCRFHHDEQHRGNELACWLSYGIADPFALAIALYAKCKTKPKTKRPREVKPRRPKSERVQIKSRKTKWPSRPFQRKPAK